MKLLHKYQTARAIIIEDGKILMFHRKRHNRVTGSWVEYYSIPGGQIDPGETAESAVIRELYEEMTVTIRLKAEVAHQTNIFFEHRIFYAEIVDGIPEFNENSEESLHMNENNQYKIEWVPVEHLTTENLRYYAGFLPVIQKIASGIVPSEVNHINEYKVI